MKFLFLVVVFLSTPAFATNIEGAEAESLYNLLSELAEVTPEADSPLVRQSVSYMEDGLRRGAMIIRNAEGTIVCRASAGNYSCGISAAN